MLFTLTIHGRYIRPDGSIDTMWTRTVPAKDKPLWWQERGLSFTASGYGKRIPTRHMVQVNGKWRRVYCCIYSNAGTCYIGEFRKAGAEFVTVTD